VVRIRFGRDFGELVVPRGTTLLAAAARAQAPLGNACRGQGVCRACAVLVIEGAALLDDPGELELRMQLESSWRMACKTHVRADGRGGETELGGRGQEPGFVELWTPNWGGWPDLD
jgi:ferredoxin